MKKKLTVFFSLLIITLTQIPSVFAQAQEDKCKTTCYQNLLKCTESCRGNGECVTACGKKYEECCKWAQCSMNCMKSCEDKLRSCTRRCRQQDPTCHDRCWSEGYMYCSRQCENQHCPAPPP